MSQISVTFTSHQEMDSHGQTTTFFNWENSFGDAAGGFTTLDAALEDAKAFHGADALCTADHAFTVIDAKARHGISLGRSGKDVH